MKVRLVSEADRSLLAAMIGKDADHLARGTTPDFFYQEQTLCLCFEDDHGPVFFMRLDPEVSLHSPLASVRVHIQFDQDQQMRTARMLLQAFVVVRERAILADARRLVFDSITGTLRDFCRKRFGFVAVSGTADMELLLPDRMPAAVAELNRVN